MENPLRTDRNYEAEAKAIMRDAELRTERVLRPIGAIGFSIIQGSTNCRDAAIKLIKSEDPNERLEKEIFLFFEFIYFFMHWTLRSAFERIDQTKLKLLQDFLLEIVPPAAIDSYFAHLPIDAKNDLIDEFVERLDKTEVEYGTCSTDGNVYPTIGLLMKNLTSILGIELTDIRKLLGILTIATREFGNMELDKYIDEFGQNKMNEQDERRMCEHLNQFRLSGM
jgi:hypothetical protein